MSGIKPPKVRPARVVEKVVFGKKYRYLRAAQGPVQAEKTPFLDDVTQQFRLGGAPLTGPERALVDQALSRGQGE